MAQFALFQALDFACSGVCWCSAHMGAGSQHAGAMQLPSEAKMVICVSWVPELAKTRELLLRQAGYDVAPVLGRQELNKIHEVTSPSLLILAHSVPREEKLEAMTLFRRDCSAPVLSLLRPYQSALPGVDYAVEAFMPREFLDAVARATSQRRSRWSVACMNCDLIFEIREDLVAFLVSDRQSTTLQCPYCKTTADYEPRELRRAPDTYKEQ
jgi:DNA-binding response OmpR family regulator